MSSRFTLPTIYANLVAKVQEVITECNTMGITEDMEYVAWDARMDPVELPNKDLLGLVDWTYDEGDDDLHLPEIECVFMLSVINDSNLFREVEIAERIRLKCVHPSRPEYLVWTLKDEDNQAFSQLKVTNFSVLPSGESEARTVRQFGISLKRADYAK